MDGYANDTYAWLVSKGPSTSHAVGGAIAASQEECLRPSTLTNHFA